MVTLKKCFKCDTEKSLEEYYKHSKMTDGHLNKCKACTRLDAKKNHYNKMENPKWRDSERKRHILKYHRLGYKEKQLEWDAQRPWKKTSTYKNLNRDLNIKPGEEAHHWSYKNENLKSVFIMNTTNHKKAHTFLNFNNKELCFELESGLLLDTREKHKSFLIKQNIIL